jgi:menaquinone-dependent protoporphyrinogen IX oxidase
MAKVLVLYYSSYGHIETMASAVAEGARGAGAEVSVKRVPELVPEAVAKASASSSTRPHRWPRWTSCPGTTPSSWACPRASATCRRR